MSTPALAQIDSSVISAFGLTGTTWAEDCARGTRMQFAPAATSSRLSPEKLAIKSTVKVTENKLKIVYYPLGTTRTNNDRDDIYVALERIGNKLRLTGSEILVGKGETMVERCVEGKL
jgi:hypothetical protein